MTRREAAIVSAYTGFMCGEFSELHKYIEEIMKRPVFPHEMANERTMKEIKSKAKADFCNLNIVE